MSACERVVEGSDTPDDNSGKLNFVRVEYAGYEIFPGNELNGIKLYLELKLIMYKFIIIKTTALSSSVGQSM